MLKKAQQIIQEIANRLVTPIDNLAYRQFYDFPFGNSPKASAETYFEIWNKAKKVRYEAIDHMEKELAYSIDENWFHDLALLTQVVIKKSDICYQHGRLLYSLLASYISKHDNIRVVNILETGTARGFSSLCMAKALFDVRKAGKIVTVDVLPHNVEMYWNCISDLKGPCSRSELLHAYRQLIEEYIIFVQGDSKLQLKKIDLPRIHMAFLDGVHTYEYVRDEFRYLKDKQKTGDIIFFDDYTPEHFPGIVRAVDEICEVNNYSKKAITINKQRGYAIAVKN